MESGAVGHNFEMGLPKDYPCQVWFKLVQRFQRKRFKDTSKGLVNSLKNILTGPVNSFFFNLQDGVYFLTKILLLNNFALLILLFPFLWMGSRST
jgi:hypothetical protein